MVGKVLRRKAKGIVGVMCCLYACLALGGTPNLIDFQGSLTDAEGKLLSGEMQFEFALFPSADGAEKLWSESKSITVIDGIYSTTLGDHTPLPDSLWDSSELWLSVSVNGETEMTPRIRIVAVPYALRAKTAESLAGGAGGDITGRMLLSDKREDAELLAAGYVPVGKVSASAFGTPWRTVSSQGIVVPDTWDPILVWTGENALVIGAEGGSGLFDPSENSWSAINTDSMPDLTQNMYSPISEWTGERLILLVDDDESPSGIVGAAYELSADQWKAMNSASLPKIDLDDTTGNSAFSFWTGERLLLLGYDSAEMKARGGRYDPVSNSWSKMNVDGIPEVAWGGNPFAAWTGEKLILLGDHAALDGSVAGGLYDPATDEWSTMNTATMPTMEVRGALIAWTADKLVAAGRPEGGGDIRGGLYDPATNEWSAMKMDGMPSLPLDDTMEKPFNIWTGDELIVAQEDDLEMEIVCGRYDPDQDKWLSMSNEGFKYIHLGGQTMYRPVSVWTGQKLFLVGQEDTADTSVVAALYDPATDEWYMIEASPLPGSPDAAAWTGKEFLFLGEGMNEDKWGALYNPTKDRSESFIFVKE